MTVNEYQKMALTTLNPALGKQDVLINGVMGLCGESGEAIDIVKKHLAQGHPLDREGLIKELGDVAWYLAETAYALDVSLEAQIINLLSSLKRETGVAMVFISHDIALTRYISDRIMVLKDGKTVEEGDTEVVMEKPKSEYTRMLLENSFL